MMEGWSAIKPVIGHVKSDHYMERNILTGAEGDMLNEMLAAAGFNQVKFMSGLKRIFCAFAWRLADSRLSLSGIF